MFRPEGFKALAQRQLLIYTLLPLAYVVSGRLGLLLAVPPGYATAVFPPAGIAAGAMFMAGAATLPGTFLGAFLLNISLGYSIAHRLDATSVAAALVIACGHILQAAIGGTVLRRVIGYPAALDNPRDLILFLLLSPVFCLASASLSLSGLWALGVVQLPELMTNWMTWWVGDTLGVLVVVPLMLVLGGQPRPLWRSRARFVAIPMVLCFALFAAIFVRLSGWENERSLREFQLRSQQLADTMKDALDEQTLFLEQLSAVFVNRHLQVARQDFRDLVQKLTQRFPAIQAVEWAPRVVSAERRAFEAAQEADLPGFVIRERGPLGQLRPAGERGQFYPVTYLEPFTGNEEAAGYDLASDANRRAAIEAAIASGKAAATAPIRLVQERGQQAGLLLVNAVPGGPAGPAGAVLVVLRMGTFAMTLADPLASTLRLRLVDAAGGRPLLDNLPASVTASYETAFDFGTRRYAVQTAPSAVYLAQHRGWQSFTVLAAGALSTGLLGALLLLGTGHAYRFERLADILNSIPTVVYVLAVTAKGFPSQWISDSVKRILGYEVDEALAADWWIDCLHPDDKEAAAKRTSILMAQGHLVQAYRFRSKDGRYLWMQDEASLFRGADGRPKEIVGFWTNISERKRAEQANLVLIGELQHRTRNLLAVVQSIARQTIRGSKGFSEFEALFNDRLATLSRAQRFLSLPDDQPATCGDVAREELAAVASQLDGSRIVLEGPEIPLPRNSVQILALALHELATNALKHGALSKPQGRLAVKWRLLDSKGQERTLSLDWLESGIDLRQTDRSTIRRGYGRELIEKALVYQLGAQTRFDLSDSGLRCMIEIPAGSPRSPRGDKDDRT